jgi:DNA polymerase-1
MSHTRLVIDMNNLAMRVWKSYPELHTSKGKQVHVIFGVLKLLRAAMVKYKPVEVMLTWDGDPEVRLAIYPDYKGERKTKKEAATPQEKAAYGEYKTQVAILKDILPAFGLDQYYEEGTEADDIIAVIAQQTDLTKRDVLILSEDKDFLQLVKKGIDIYRPVADKYYNIGNFAEQVKLPTPQHYINARYIMGDSSDGIPGIPGLKEGRVFPVIQEYGTVNNILLNEATLNKGKVWSYLFSNEGKAELGRNVALMNLDYSSQFLQCDLDDLKQEGSFDERDIKRELMKYEFISYLRGFQDFISPFRHA